MATTFIRRLDGRKPPRGASWGAAFETRKPRRSGGSSTSTHSRGGSSSRPSHGGGQGGGRPATRGRKNFQEMAVNLNQLINKAKPAEEIEAYVPDLNFAELPIDQQLKDNILAKGYLLPTPIQDKSIPQVLMGHDIVGLANTGTGKTAAFLIPLINRVIFDRNQRMLIMVPTRELALQIETEFYGFTKRLNINAVTCVGGAAIEPQLRGLRRTPNFVIGTPGRLKDFIDRRELDLSSFATVVLDEADRMLDMGFIGDMREIMAYMPAKRHTLFFSATLSRDIEKLIGEFLNDPVRISVKTRDTAATIDQDVIYFTGSAKFEKLVEVLKQIGMDKVLVFGRTKFGVERLAKDLSHNGIKAESIHGDKTHGRRQKALTMFKQDQVQVLVATDVAARGLDISGVSHVINYDLPGTYEDYTHRIGRTGRAGKTGKALTFVAQ